MNGFFKKTLSFFGLTDEEDASDAQDWHLDADGDGHGDPASSTRACTAPAGFVAGSGDCDDTQPAVYSGAPEICDSLDNDCNEMIDDDDPGISGHEGKVFSGFKFLKCKVSFLFGQRMYEVICRINILERFPHG